MYNTAGVRIGNAACALQHEINVAVGTDRGCTAYRDHPLPGRTTPRADAAKWAHGVTPVFLHLTTEYQKNRSKTVSGLNGSEFRPKR